MTNFADGVDDDFYGSQSSTRKAEFKGPEYWAFSKRVSASTNLIPAIFLAFCAVLLMATPADAAQQGERKKSVFGTAADAATQPLEDFNLKSGKIPEELQRIQEEPYSVDGLSTCDAVREEIATLEGVLGPDADSREQKTGMVNKALKTGGSFLGSFIPFRGVVREVSGANSKRKKLERAIYTGVARRGFLKGYAEGRQCKTTEELAIEAAEIRMGLREKPDNDFGDANETSDASDESISLDYSDPAIDPYE